MISVVIPLYNKEERIAFALSSVLEQRGDIEIIVVDDGSTDDSFKVVESINDNRIKLMRQPNGGPSKARNTGAKAATGDWVFFLDADDELLPGALEIFLKFVCKYPKEKCFAANFYSVKDNRRRIFSPFYYEKVISRPHWAWDFCGLFPRTGALLIHKSVANEFQFDEKLRRYEDAEWLFRIMQQYNFVRIPDPVMLYNNDSLAASVKRKNINEDYLGHLKLNDGTWGERLAIFQLYNQAKCLYPEDVKLLYSHQLKFIPLIILSILYIISKMFRKIIRLSARFMVM